MKVKILKSIKGADRDPSGISKGVKLYLKDHEYDIGDSLAKVFLDLGAAEEVSILPIEEENSEEVAKPAKKKKKKKKKVLKKKPGHENKMLQEEEDK